MKVNCKNFLCYKNRKLYLITFDEIYMRRLALELTDKIKLQQ